MKQPNRTAILRDNPIIRSLATTVQSPALRSIIRAAIACKKVRYPNEESADKNAQEFMRKNKYVPKEGETLRSYYCDRGTLGTVIDFFACKNKKTCYNTREGNKICHF